MAHHTFRGDRVCMLRLDLELLCKGSGAVLKLIKLILDFRNAVLSACRGVSIELLDTTRLYRKRRGHQTIS
jgi:hypothetical protein